MNIRGVGWGLGWLCGYIWGFRSSRKLQILSRKKQKKNKNVEKAMQPATVQPSCVLPGP